MPQDPGLLYLSRAVLQSLGLTAADTIRQIETLCRGRDRGDVLNAPKSALRPEPNVLFMSTTALAEEPPHMAVKALGVNTANADHGLETTGSLITLFDRKTALPFAVMEGYWITMVRTASLSAVAAKYFARPDASVAAFIGCGAQAHTHLDALLQMFALREIRIFGRGQTNRDILCQRGRDLGLAAHDCETARDAVTDADIIISSTPTTTAPIRHLDAGWLKPGAFASLVDIARPWIEDSLRRFDGIVIDDLEQEAQMPVQMLDTALISGDLQDLVTGRISGRKHDRERHAFIFRGLALADLALASLAYQAAVDAGVGVFLER